MRLVKQLSKTFQSLGLKRKGINISPLAYYDDKCNFEENIYIDRFCNLHNVKIEQYSYVGYGTSINLCEIGKYCSIGGDVKIGLGKHPLNFVSTSPIFYSNENCLGVKLVNEKEFIDSSKVYIGNDVWVGSNAIIMGGLSIGHGAVIGAGSVVTKDVPPYAVVGGVPAKIIKYRFDEEEIKKLLEMKWWNWEIDKIKTHINKFTDLKRLTT
ncbi:acetyltransferase-like isoleucine patch superfamily enzyme [Peribacillus frigoritolerans]|uniref:CatB-related O-acetyltransferase n=1 Tax=Peribacillus frigoritolerans TaxID=450367 RepID=UPI00119B1157|nr:CatB-related O-acetyltransferase [Peribacillus frigoritolerans]TWE04177.1 acetyltransferase-like isoleucine patch superfamily enzyme [Peribacillus frigoritolerans]